MKTVQVVQTVCCWKDVTWQNGKNCKNCGFWASTVTNEQMYEISVNIRNASYKNIDAQVVKMWLLHSVLACERVFSFFVDVVHVFPRPSCVHAVSFSPPYSQPWNSPHLVDMANPQSRTVPVARSLRPVKVLSPLTKAGAIIIITSCGVRHNKSRPVLPPSEWYWLVNASPLSCGRW